MLDAETLETIQKIDETPTIPVAEGSYDLTQEDIDDEIGFLMDDHCCYLFGDLLYHTFVFEKEFSWGDYIAIVKIYEWNKSSGHFEAIQQREFQFSSRDVDKPNPKVYVDDRYFIFEREELSGDKLLRQIQVRCINTMELIRVREFQYPDNYHIEKEYNDGIIVVATQYANGKPNVIVWDVLSNTVGPVTNYPGTLNNSFFLALFQNYEMMLCGDDQSEMQLTKKNKKNETRAEYYRNEFNFSYCDGVQAFGFHRSNKGDQLGVFDLIQTM